MTSANVELAPRTLTLVKQLIRKADMAVAGGTNQMGSMTEALAWELVAKLMLLKEYLAVDEKQADERYTDKVKETKA